MKFNMINFLFAYLAQSKVESLESLKSCNFYSQKTNVRVQWRPQSKRSSSQKSTLPWRRCRSRTIWQSRLMLSGSGFSRSRWRRHRRCRESQRRNGRACICKCPLWARSARRRWCWGGWWPHRKGRSRAGSTWTWTNWLQCPMLDLWQLVVMRLLHSFYIFSVLLKK